jgi:hypothetical protein
MLRGRPRWKHAELLSALKKRQKRPVVSNRKKNVDRERQRKRQQMPSAGQSGKSRKRNASVRKRNVVNTKQK